MGVQAALDHTPALGLILLAIHLTLSAGVAGVGTDAIEAALPDHTVALDLVLTLLAIHLTLTAGVAGVGIEHIEGLTQMAKTHRSAGVAACRLPDRAVARQTILKMNTTATTATTHTHTHPNASR